MPKRRLPRVRVPAWVPLRLALKWTGLLAALLVPGLASSASLLDAYRLAQQNDPKYRSIQAEVRAIGTTVDQARAGFFPTVKLDVDTLETHQRIISSQNPIFAAGTSHFDTQSKTLSITQPIFRKDVIERFSQAQAVVRQAQYTLLAAEQDLQLRTAAAYLLVLAAADSVSLARAERDAVGKTLELAREKLKSGVGTIIGEFDAAARHAVTQAREIEAQNRLRDARQALREITGALIENMQSLREDFPLEAPEPADVTRWLETAATQNLTLSARREGIEVARLEVERLRAGHLPSVNLLINRNRRDAGSTLFGGGSNVDTTEVTLRLSVPIFEGGLTYAVTTEAAHRFTKSQEDYELESRSVDRATRAFYDGTLSGVSLVQALKQSVISQEKGLEWKELGYKSGLLTLLPVLDAQRDLYLARRDFAQSRYDYLLNRLRLKQAVGTLSEADLASISTAFR